MIIAWILTNFLTTAGFILALVLLLHLLKERRSASSTIAWVLAIIFIPYLGIPLYIMLGGRKLKKMIGKKEILPFIVRDAMNEDDVETAEKQSDGGTLFPLRNGNNVSLLFDGEKTFHLLMKMIKNARESIYVTTLILGNDITGEKLVEALAAKADEGVDVRLLMDALGSNNIKDSFFARFKKSGGKYAFFMPMLHIPFRGRANLRNHRKMFVVDGKSALIGGMNLAEEYMGEKPDESRWQDISLSLDGPVIEDLLTVFRSDWSFATGEGFSPVSRVTEISGHDEQIPLQLIPSGPDVTGDTLYDTVLTALFSARERILIVTPYFIPDEMLVKALCVASRRGVDVKIVVPEVSNHKLADIVRRNFLREIQEAGGGVYLYRDGMLHGKLIVIDNSLGIVGSMNMDVRSFFLNYEIALFIYSESIVSDLKNWFSCLLKNSVSGVKKEPIFVNYIEGLARFLAPLL